MEKKIQNMSFKEKLQELKKIVSIMKEDAEGHGYNYVTEESILLAINDKMIELGLKLTPSFIQNTLKAEPVNYQNTKGQAKTDILVTSEMVFTWEDITTGEKEDIPWILVGQQADGSQAFGSGLTYANRYFLLKYFNIATSKDDPDKIRSEMEAEEERKKISATQTKVKKMYEKALKKYQVKEKVYEALGVSRDEFIEIYNDPDKAESLLEQLTLILKEEKNA